MDDGREVGGEPICVILKDPGTPMAPSNYYAANTRPTSARRPLRELITDVRTAHQANLGVHGARKIHAELNRSREGLSVVR